MSWFATLARQLIYSRGDREKLWHWPPGSLTPEHYDRVTCATELRLRDEILQRVRNGLWPAGPFGIPPTAATVSPETVSGSATSVLATDAGNLSDVDISDLFGVLDVEGSEGYFWPRRAAWRWFFYSSAVHPLGRRWDKSNTSFGTVKRRLPIVLDYYSDETSSLGFGLIIRRND